MVQRLAPEKGTIRCLEALATVARKLTLAEREL